MTKVTLGQVAQAADVSLATASKALNGRHDVAPETRARVLEAAATIGWQPVATRGGHHRPTRSVAVVFDTVSNFYVPQVLEGMLDAGREAGLGIIVATRGRGPARKGSVEAGAANWVHQMADQGASGVILVNVPATADRVAACQQRGLALVCVDPSTAPPPDGVTTVASTNWRGGMQATNHLIELGHRRIGLLFGPTGAVPTEERRAGYLTAMRSAGLPVDPELMLDGGFRYEGGLVATRYLLGLDEPPTAIFAQCDEMAMGAYEAARRMRRTIPDELSVVGFDDGFAAQYSAPPLTTVRQPLERMGAVAIDAISDILNDRTPHPVQLETKLVIRASTAPPPAQTIR